MTPFPRSRPPRARRQYLLQALVLSTLAGACSDLPTGGRATPSDVGALRSGGPLTLQAVLQDSRPSFDDHLANVDGRVPGFGGIYRDDVGRLHVRLKNPRDKGLIAKAVVDEFGGNPTVGVDEMALAGSVIDSSAYSFGELLAIKKRYYSVMDVAHMVYVDIDERSNKLVIAVDDASAAAVERQKLADAGASSEAAVVVVAPRRYPADGLYSQIRPTQGGLNVQTGKNGVAIQSCSLGFNVQFPGYSVPHWLTAAHCTSDGTNSEIGVVNSAWFGNQPTGLAASDSIGREEFDFHWDSGWPSCVYTYPGATCRWADVAAFRYPVGTTSAVARVGLIARPLKENPVWNSIGVMESGYNDINKDNPFLVVGITNPIQGDSVHHIGRSTGWQSGYVNQTCSDNFYMSTSTQTRVMMCQVEANGMGDRGDSGGPVFLRDLYGSPTNVYVAGILSYVSCPQGSVRTACTFGFSPMANIQKELGTGFTATY